MKACFKTGISFISHLLLGVLLIHGSAVMSWGGEAGAALAEEHEEPAEAAAPRGARLRAAGKPAEEVAPLRLRERREERLLAEEAVTAAAPELTEEPEVEPDRKEEAPADKAAPPREGEKEEPAVEATPPGVSGDGEQERLELEIMPTSTPGRKAEVPVRLIAPLAVSEEGVPDEAPPLVSPESEKLPAILAPPSVREAEKEHDELIKIDDKQGDRDLAETVELMERAAEGPPVVAEAPVVPAPIVPAPEAKAPEPTVPEEVPIEDQMIMFDFKDADITHVLRLMSRKAGVNIIYGPEITGKVTMSLETEIPWETALALILRLHNYAYIKDVNIYRVVPVEDLEKEPTQTETFMMSYAKAKEVMGSINQMLTPARGQIKADTRSNMLIITDVPAKLDQIRRIIKRLDRRTPQVLIEARIVELSDDFLEDIGIDWVMLRDWDISAGQPPGDDQHLMTFTDSWTDLDTRNVTRSFTGQSRHDETFAAPFTTSTSNTVLSTFPGVDSGTTLTTDSTGPTGTDSWTNRNQWDASNTRRDDSLRTKSQIKSAVLDADDLALALNFLQDQTDSTLISHPKIVTADAREAVIKIVRQYPIPKFQYNDEIGRFEVSDIEFKDIGVILYVTPYVNIDNYITLQIAPEVSTQVGTVPFTGATNVDIPIIQARTAKTTVLIKDGDTLVIGGLMREDEVEVVRKVPIFGDTPFIGRYFFSNVSTDIQRRNLMIFVTAQQITDENKDIPWARQKASHDRVMVDEEEKWWHPKRLSHGMNAGKEKAKDTSIRLDDISMDQESVQP